MSTEYYKDNVCIHYFNQNVCFLLHCDISNFRIFKSLTLQLFYKMTHFNHYREKWNITKSFSMSLSLSQRIPQNKDH